MLAGSRKQLCVLLIAAMVAAVYWPLLGAEFTTFDDDVWVSRHPALNPPGPAGLQRVWTEPQLGLYVPVTYTLWSGVASVAWLDAPDPDGLRLNPWAFHAANLLLHTLAAWVVLWILWEVLAGAAWPALAGALLFAVHPLQVEAVGWVSGMKDLLAGLLALASVAMYLRWARQATLRSGAWSGRGWYLLATAAFALAMLSKPTAVSVPVIAAALDWCVIRRPLRRVVTALAPWALLAIPIVVIAKVAQPGTEATFTALWQRPLIAADALAFYMAKLVAPLSLGLDYGRPPREIFASGQAYWTWMFPAMLAAAIGLAWRRWGDRTPAAAGGAFVGWVLPVLGFIPFHWQLYTTVTDHYIYAGMLGPAILLTWAVRRWPGRASNVAAGIVLVLLGAMSWRQSWHWRDSAALYAQALRVNPDSFFSRHNYALILDRKAGELRKRGEASRAAALEAEAFDHLVMAARLMPDMAGLHVSVVQFLARHERYDEAVARARAVLAHLPEMPPQQQREFASLHFLAAHALLRLGRPAEARQEAERYIAYRPDDSEGHKLLRRLEAAHSRPSGP